MQQIVLTSESLGDKAYKILRSFILKGEIRPGTRLTESQLAGEMRISRTPVRDALRLLEKDGLLISEGLKGYTVIHFSCKSIDEIFDTRLMIETHALRTASPPELDKWIAQHTGEPMPAGEIEPIIDMDDAFHTGLVTAMNNQMISDFYYNVNTRMKVLWLYIYSDEEYQVHNTMLSSIMSHGSIIESCKAGDIDQAVERLTKHVNDSRDYALKHFKEKTVAEKKQALFASAEQDG